MLNVLLSAMHLDNENYIDTLNICSNAVIINQCDRSSSKDVMHRCIDGTEHDVTYIETTNRGLSNSRNMAIDNAKSDICILCDNDVEYVTGYERMIMSEFDKYKDADVIVFYIRRPERLQPNYNKPRKMGYLSVLKIFSPEIAFRKSSIEGIRFNELFGAGAKYNMGEENLFLYECLKKHKKIMYVPVHIATLRDEESTWFKGYDKQFFIARGANYEAMSSVFSHLLIWQFALRKRALYLRDISMLSAVKAMYEGRRKYKEDLKG